MVFLFNHFILLKIFQKILLKFLKFHDSFVVRLTLLLLKNILVYWQIVLILREQFFGAAFRGRWRILNIILIVGKIIVLSLVLTDILLLIKNHLLIFIIEILLEVSVTIIGIILRLISIIILIIKEIVILKLNRLLQLVWLSIWL